MYTGVHLRTRLALRPWRRATLATEPPKLQALLYDLGFEGFGIRGALAHGDLCDKGNGARSLLVDTIALIAGTLKV